MIARIWHGRTRPEHPESMLKPKLLPGISNIGYGSRFDEKNVKALAPGSFYPEPPDVRHFARTGDRQVVVQNPGYGPTVTQYTESGQTK